MTQPFAPIAVNGRAALLGVVAGMRSQLPLALLAYAARQGRFAANADQPLGLLRAPAALPLLALSAAGEMVADKLPFVPSRLAPGPLGGRLLIGGLAGGIVARVADQPVLAGALLGAAGAGLGAYAGYHARVWLGQATGLPDPVWAVVEDSAALALGLAAVSPARNPGSAPIGS